MLLQHGTMGTADKNEDSSMHLEQDAFVMQNLPGAASDSTSVSMNTISKERVSDIVSSGDVSRTRHSFKSSDEFFHGMLSYRVRSEGPKGAGGNNFAKLIYEACSQAVDIKKTSNETQGSES